MSLAYYNIVTEYRGGEPETTVTLRGAEITNSLETSVEPYDLELVNAAILSQQQRMQAHPQTTTIRENVAARVED